MTSIERTAYPRLKRRPSAQELADVYTPTTEDLAFIRATARGPSPTLTLAVLLKVLQRLRSHATPAGRAVRRRRPRPGQPAAAGRDRPRRDSAHAVSAPRGDPH